MLPAADLRSFTFDPVGARIGPMASLEAVASDRPTASLDLRRSDHPVAIPAVVSADAGTRAALLSVMRDVRFPTSLMAMSPLATGVVRRGPPLPSGTSPSLRVVGPGESRRIEGRSDHDDIRGVDRASAVTRERRCGG
jgi:hypothetical protein